MLRRRLLLQLVLTLEGLSAVTARHRLRTHPGLFSDHEFLKPPQAVNALEFDSRINRLYLEKLLTESRLKVIEDAYLLESNKRQRDKRYTSHMKLCHFKICNMGRKRTPRYLHMD